MWKVILNKNNIQDIDLDKIKKMSLQDLKKLFFEKNLLGITQGKCIIKQTFMH